MIKLKKIKNKLIRLTRQTCDIVNKIKIIRKKQTTKKNYKFQSSKKLNIKR
jgi:hypothetical protein